MSSQNFPARNVCSPFQQSPFHLKRVFSASQFSTRHPQSRSATSYPATGSTPPDPISPSLATKAGSPP
ncbi:uncharacterized protein PODANS_3_2980 [Podospora anserina S mat+]|uniref:Podospora anserina S mat+ genomic DNA chromosome 3, supercontig 2 n=1 Tax=Podospora anserina (strain S / ATCC MYA-4624 / DSM 980 / FGSC 10383) TaxID=515849 RepID=B2AZ95_PODAN|nr:uncharacterized protein PODANS_3_2980 [Podospora anserina S mat+]CAP70209.1 unnamed protein product [Podospora anserina S mat+]CDP26802.1 Putative protein of unknown function [Podospora anserina S mat+]